MAHCTVSSGVADDGAVAFCARLQVSDVPVAVPGHKQGSSEALVRYETMREPGKESRILEEEPEVIAPWIFKTAVTPRLHLLDGVK